MIKRAKYRWRGKGEEREDSGKKNRRQAVLEERFDIVGFLAFFSYSLLTTILRRAAVTRGERANQNGLQNTLLVYEILADEGRMLSLALTLPLPLSHSALLSWLSTDLHNSISSYRAFPIHQNWKVNFAYFSTFWDTRCGCLHRFCAREFCAWNLHTWLPVCLCLPSLTFTFAAMMYSFAVPGSGPAQKGFLPGLLHFKSMCSYVLK